MAQLVTCRTVASPVSRVAPHIGAGAHGLLLARSAYVGRRCSISRPHRSVATAVAPAGSSGSGSDRSSSAGSAAGDSTGGAAGKTSESGCKSSVADSKQGRRTGNPPRNTSRAASGRAADNGRTTDRGNAGSGSATERTKDAGSPWQRPSKRSKQGRSVISITLDINGCSTIQQLQHLVQQDDQDMNHINLTAAIGKLPKLLCNIATQRQQQVQGDSLFGELWQLQQPKLSECDARALSNMIYSVCLLPKPMLRRQQYQWVLAQHLLPAFVRQVPNADSQAISMVLYGLADSGQQLPVQSTQLLVDQLVAVLPDASLQSISNTTWAVATMSRQIQPTQLQQLLDAFCAVAQKAEPQGIANTLWAVATMQQHIHSMQLQQLLNAFCAVAQKAEPQEIANTLWAVATMKQQVEPGQLDQMLGALVMKLREAVPQNVSNTLWACAEFRYLPKLLLTATALLDKLAAANPQNLANTAWACGQLGYRDEQLMSALLNHVLDLVGNSKQNLISSGVTAQHLANLCWSLAVLDLREHAPAVVTLVQAAKPLWASMVPENLLQLHQVHMWLIDHSLATGQGLTGVLSAHQLQQCQSTWQRQLDMTAKTVSGSFQQSVFKTLQNITALQRTSIKWLVPPATEQVSLAADGQPDGAALIDITARTTDGAWLAVEVDGPTHFRRSDRGLMGPTLYRNRALAVRGYVLITVPYYEWNIQHSSKVHQRFLLDKVEAALQQAAINRDAQPRGVPLQHHRQSSSRQSRPVGNKLIPCNSGDPSNAVGSSLDLAKTDSRASISVDRLGNTCSQGGRVRRTRRKNELP